jgi:hypothetical protein
MDKENVSSFINISIKEYAGICRRNEPITVGVPFQKGALQGMSKLSLFDQENNPVPIQAQPLNLWSDGSIRWVLLDFQTSAKPNTTSNYNLYIQKNMIPLTSGPTISIAEAPDTIIVNTGPTAFYVDAKCFKPFKCVKVNGIDLIDSRESCCVLKDAAGKVYDPTVEHCKVETIGPLRTTLLLKGTFRSPKNQPLADFFARLHFYANHSFTKVEFTIRNPRAAKHPGGLWDLGDKGSIYFKELSFNTAMVKGRTPIIEWKTQPNNSINSSNSMNVEIYQDSSGGDNWQSRNHVNRYGEVKNSFRGYRVTNTGKVVEEGYRANPVLYVGNDRGKIGAAIPNFWQNFPKALETRDGILTVKLFPDRCSDVFELQGGEQKTHSVAFSFSTVEASSDLDWVYSSLIPYLSPEYYAQTKVFSYLTPIEKDSNVDYCSLMDSIIEGKSNFFSRREIIDEYGWRNFGDLYADHENLHYDGQKPVISHYNNQYDALYGFLLQYVRSGDLRWFQLSEDLARHVIDIDIYHSNKDKTAYNGGLFWHTDHYIDAATSTHRTYSKRTMDAKHFKDYGGGPSNEHNYTTGLLYYYLMAGNLMAKDAVIGLADWVINMDDGKKNPFRFLSQSPTGLSSHTGSRDYHKPGRGCGNSANALMDAFILTGNRKYLDKGEELIKRCIHPKDDIKSVNLLSDPEHRWSYTAFLQVSGKYLDLKNELGQADYMYYFARESLLHYAKWMAENEIPFKQMLDRVEYPTESWIVMDMRKSNVFDYAAKYAHNEESCRIFFEKAKFFYTSCLKDLMDFETRTFMRPMVMLINYGTVHPYFEKYFCTSAVINNPHEYDFGQPEVFVPQRSIVKKRLLIGMLYGFIGLMLFSAWFIFT